MLVDYGTPEATAFCENQLLVSQRWLMASKVDIFKINTDCSSLVKFGTEFNQVTADMLYIFHFQVRESKVKVTA